MRLLGLVLLFLLASGCGNGDPSNSTRGPHFGTGTFPPSINQLTPNTAPVNSAPFTMTIQGQNFLPDAVVFWNAMPQQTTFVSATQLQVAVTATDLTFSGLNPIVVRTGGMNSNTVDFNETPQ